MNEIIMNIRRDVKDLDDKISQLEMFMGNFQSPNDIDSADFDTIDVMIIDIRREFETFLKADIEKLGDV